MNTSTNRRSASSARATRRLSTSTRRLTSSAQSIANHNASTRKSFGTGRPRKIKPFVLPAVPAPDSLSLGDFKLDTANKGNGIKLLKALPDNTVRTAFFDPQYPGGVKNWDKQKEGGSFQAARAELKQMSEVTIAKFFRQLSRVIAPSGHVFLWIDKHHCLHGFEHWLTGTEFEKVDLITWSKNSLGLGCRTRSSGEFLIVLQKAPVRAKGCWTKKNIRSVWAETVDKKSHVHTKPLGLQKALIEATTQPGDLVLDPCSGSFSVMQAAMALGRRFVGCDLDGAKRCPQSVVSATAARAGAKRAAKKVKRQSKKTKTTAMPQSVAHAKRRLMAARAGKPTAAELQACKLAERRRASMQGEREAKAAAKSVSTLLSKLEPKVARDGTAKRSATTRRAAAVKPVAAKRPVRRGGHGQAQAPKVPRDLLARGGFVLVPMNVLNVLAANEPLWTYPGTLGNRRPRAQARAVAA